jgi:chorismate mutase
MQRLDKLRDELQQLNQAMFDIWQTRKNLVQQIQKHKDISKEYFCFSPAIEYQLFFKYSENLKVLSLQELLAYSLLIESHASVGPSSYPSWSLRVHLIERTSDEIYEQINPILLAVTDQSLYDKLPINQKFQALLLLAR